MITRRVQGRAHSLKTGLPLVQSSRLAAKSCSAFRGSAVSMSDNVYKLCMSSLKIRQKSEPVVYVVVRSLELGCILATATSVINWAFTFLGIFRLKRYSAGCGICARVLSA